MNNIPSFRIAAREALIIANISFSDASLSVCMRSTKPGVTTPKELIGDDEYERAIEDEYEHVMQKAKTMKEIEQRETLLQLGIDPDAKDRVAKTRPRVLPDPRDRERIGAPVPHWLDAEGGSANAPLLPGDGSSEHQPQQQLGIGDGLEAGDGA